MTDYNIKVSYQTKVILDASVWEGAQEESPSGDVRKARSPIQTVIKCGNCIIERQ